MRHYSRQPASILSLLLIHLVVRAEPAPNPANSAPQALPATINDSGHVPASGATDGGPPSEIPAPAKAPVSRYIPLDAAGQAIPLIERGGKAVPAVPPRCVTVKDQHLTWEVKTADGGLQDQNWSYTWFDGKSGVAGQALSCGGTLGTASCDTLNYLKAINTMGLCGFAGGWRLPTPKELMGLVEDGQVAPAIDPDFFPNTRSARYWSGKPLLDDPSNAWLVFFLNGSMSYRFAAHLCHVRLVHDGP